MPTLGKMSFYAWYWAVVAFVIQLLPSLAFRQGITGNQAPVSVRSGASLTTVGTCET